MKEKKAVVAGHVCVDITPVFPKQSAGALGEILVPGSLIHMDGVDVHTGGAVANTGLAMKKLGANVRLMGKVGNDEFGRIVQNIFSEYDADKALIETEDAATSYTVALAVPGFFCMIRVQTTRSAKRIWIWRPSVRRICFILAIPLS